MEKNDCPNWFKMVVCVILYRYNDGELEFWLVDVSDNKLAISGGVGGFAQSKSLLDFACIEVNFDTGLVIVPDDLQYFETVICDDRLIIFFSHHLESGKIERGKWFKIEEIRDMQHNGIIAFNNDTILEKFANN